MKRWFNLPAEPAARAKRGTDSQLWKPEAIEHALHYLYQQGEEPIPPQELMRGLIARLVGKNLINLPKKESRPGSGKLVARVALKQILKRLKEDGLMHEGSEEHPGFHLNEDELGRIKQRLRASKLLPQR